MKHNNKCRIWRRWFIFIAINSFVLLFAEELHALFPSAPAANAWMIAGPLSLQRSTTTAKTRHNVVFTRLSEDCLAALQVAQTAARELQQSSVDDPCLLLGVCHHPGRCSDTLDQFGITPAKVQRVLDYLKPQKSSSSINTAAPRLSDFILTSRKETPPELPWSAETQQTLFAAGKVSKAMGASQIEPEHVWLGLLQYSEQNETITAATRSDDCPAMEVLYHLDATLEGEDICVPLLQSLMEQQKQPQLQPQNQQPQQQQQQQQRVPSSKDSNKSWLDECGIDLTQQAADGALDRMYGRDQELQSCLQILLRRRKNNVCLTGEAGVGKTAIVEGLAQLLVNETACPPALRGYRLVSLQVSALVAGTQYRGEMEARLRSILEEITTAATTSARKIILFIDEIHTLVGAGATGDGSLDASNLLKPYLARGQLQIVGATTVAEYNRHIAKDPALERRFQPVLVQEPSVEATVELLRAVLPSYRAHHRVEFEDAALVAAAQWSDRYLPDRFLPDKAIDLVDQAGAVASLHRNTTSLEAPVVSEHDIGQLLSQWTGIPVGQLRRNERKRLQELEAVLEQRVRGQERAIRTVARALKRARTGVRNPRRPIATFLLVGPTGTGKTELCKTLADTYFGSERDMVRIDMSEYMSKSSVTRLTGPPPGLVGYEEGGQLTEAVRRAPHSVVLLDELEKAHGDVLNILLQILEDGVLTDGQGRTVSFKNTVVVMTSNIGSRQLLKAAQRAREHNPDASTSLSTAQKEKIEYAKLAAVVKVELEKELKPEVLNRIDDIVVFKPLTEKELSLIATAMILEIVSRMKAERNLDIIVSGALLEKVVRDGSLAADQFGARPMRRTVQRILEDAISEAVVDGFLVEGDVALFDLQHQEIEDDEAEDFFVVTVSRERDGEIFQVEIEKSTRDTVTFVPEPDDASEDDGDHTDDDVNGTRDSDPEYLLASD